MLQVIYKGNHILPMRPEATDKTFGSSDVPHGTDSVIYKAARHLNENHGANISIPAFTEEQVKARIEIQKAKLSFLEIEETLDSSIEFHLQTKLAPPTAAAVKSHLDSMRGFSDMDIKSYIQKHSMPEKPVTEAQAIEALRKPGVPPAMSKPALPTLAEAEVALKEVMKSDMAKAQVKFIHDNCLEVPELTEAFVDLFTTKPIE